MSGGMLHIYYGDGKGKTTAAAGTALRAAGRGYAVLFARFMKTRESGEIIAMRQTDRITVIGPMGDFPFYRDMTEEQKQALYREHMRVFAQIAPFVKAYERTLVVCDELLHAIAYDLVDKKAVLSWICAKETEIIVTGRRVTEPVLYEAADYVTRMQAERHPFEWGITAREGIEY